MPLETRNLIKEKEFGPELAGARVGWSAVTGYGRRPDEMAAVHIATATIGKDGAKLEYEPREKDGQQIKAYWNDAAEGFIAMAGISVIIDRTKPATQQQRGNGPYLSLEGYSSFRSNDGKILRQAADGYTNEEALDEKKVWAESNREIITNTKELMSEADLDNYYPLVYYTANVAFISEKIGEQSRHRDLSAKALIMPDPEMHDLTEDQIKVASTIVELLSTEISEDKSMKANLTAFGNIPPEEIPDKFETSRRMVAQTEQQAAETEKQLLTQIGVFLPIGFHGGRSWPYMSADLPPDDERAFGRELHELERRNVEPALHELRREIDELEYRAKYAKGGHKALESLSAAEESSS